MTAENAFCCSIFHPERFEAAGLFEKQLEILERMDLDKPLCFKVEVSNDGQFAKTRVLKIMDLNEAKKEKIETKVVEVPLEPKVLMIDLDDNLEEKFDDLVMK